MSLYQINAEYADKLAALETAETEEELESLYNAIDALDGDIAIKSEQYARVVQNLKANVEAYKTEIKRLQTAKEHAENAVKKMTSMLMETMHTAGFKTLQTPIGKWSLKLNPPAVEVVDVDRIPELFFRPQPLVLDKAALREALNRGVDIDGAHLIQRESLSLK